jgi:hypothetical protein
MLSLRKLSYFIKSAGASIPISNPAKPQFVPRLYLEHFKNSSPSAVNHLQWLIQKGVLKQDIILVGPPGPHRRRLAMAFCELAGREVEVLTISQDTTEADLKQRREIVNSTAVYIDQGPVRAALEV